MADSDDYVDRKKDEQNFTVKEKIEDRQNKAHIMNLQGFSIKEISEKLAVSPSTVEKDLYEMRKNYKKRLKMLDIMGYRNAFLGAVANIEAVLTEAWKLFRVEKNGKIKTNLLKLILDTLIQQKELLKYVPLPPMSESETMEHDLEKMRGHGL